MNQTELQGARLLLKKGVLVPIAAPLLFRIFGIKVFKLKVKAPTAYQLLRIAELYLQMNVSTYSELNTNDVMQLYVKHHDKLSRIIAISMLKSTAKDWQINLLARRLYKNATQEQLNYIFRLLILHGGVQDFISTIKLVEETRITKPMNLSPEEKTS